MSFKKKLLALALSATFLGSLIPTTSVNAEEPRVAATQTAERRFVAYFTDWAYRNEQNQYYTADMMPWDKITHINYAFAKVNGQNNKIDFCDKEAATEIELPGQTAEFPYKGHFNVINSYKKKYPKVKSLISVGGWAASQEFFAMMSTPQGRETFANSCVDFVRDYGFDGVDIDFEYPTNLENAGNPNDFDVAKPYRKEVYYNYCRTLEMLRKKLDEAALVDGKKYDLTAAVTASAWVVSGMGEENFTKYLDFINLMTYDFHGSWNGFVAHNSPLYSDPEDPEIKYWKLNYNYLSTDWAVKYYSGMMDPENIVIGIPYYTRGWQNVKPGTKPGGLYGSAWKGVMPDGAGDGAIGIDNIWHDDYADGTEEPGGSNPLWHVKNLLSDKSLGYVRYWDNVSKVPYVWNEGKKVFLSFEDEQSMNEKVDYIIKNNLGGAMCWEIDGDFDYDQATNKYVVGDTLTTIAYEKFKAAGPIVIEKPDNTLPVMDFDIEVVNSYDHPSNSFKVYLVNNTGKTIPKPATIEFDLPNCFSYDSAPWSSGADIKITENGMYKHFKITVADWGLNLATGKTLLCEGDILLRPLGGAKNMRLNGNASKREVEENNRVDMLGAAVSASTIDSRDGNYSISVNVPANSKATSFSLYEGDKVIKTQAVTSTANKYTYNMTNKPNGTYKYKVVMTDGKNNIESTIVSVYVGPEIVLKAPVVMSSVDNSSNGSYTVTVSIPSNSNGKIVTLYEGSAAIGSKNVSNVAQDFTFNITGKKNGNYTYKAVLSDGIKTIDSNTKTVKVYNDYGATQYDPAKTYDKGKYVIYNGKIYVGIAWWIPVNSYPDKNSTLWEYVDEADVPTVVDLATVASKYNKKSTDSGYEVECDLDSNGIIDIYDLVIVAKKM